MAEVTIQIDTVEFDLIDIDRNNEDQTEAIELFKKNYPDLFNALFKPAEHFKDTLEFKIYGDDYFTSRVKRTSEDYLKLRFLDANHIPAAGEEYTLTIDGGYPVEAYKLFYRICWPSVKKTYGKFASLRINISPIECPGYSSHTGCCEFLEEGISWFLQQADD
tara:strand:- start:95 stop:583 length:489 start_codon:yes stop_codon:yes gene_type:complete